MTIYGGQEPSRNRAVVRPAKLHRRQVTQAGGIDSLESNPRLLKSLKYRLRRAGTTSTTLYYYYIYTVPIVPQCLSSRPNWVRPLPHLLASVAPLACVRGGRRTTGEKAWHSVYSVVYTHHPPHTHSFSLWIMIVWSMQASYRSFLFLYSRTSRVLLQCFKLGNFPLDN